MTCSQIVQNFNSTYSQLIHDLYRTRSQYCHLSQPLLIGFDPVKNKIILHKDHNQSRYLLEAQA